MQSHMLSMRVFSPVPNFSSRNLPYPGRRRVKDFLENMFSKKGINNNTIWSYVNRVHLNPNPVLTHALTYLYWLALLFKLSMQRLNCNNITGMSLASPMRVGQLRGQTRIMLLVSQCCISLTILPVSSLIAVVN